MIITKENQTRWSPSWDLSEQAEFNFAQGAGANERLIEPTVADSGLEDVSAAQLADVIAFLETLELELAS